MERRKKIARPGRRRNARWLKKAIEAEGTKPFVMINAEAPQVPPSEIMKVIAPRLPHGLDGVTMMRTTLQAIDDSKIPLKSSHRADFQAGLPIYFAPIVVPVLSERRHGRPEVTGMKARTRDAFNVGMTLCVEVVRRIVDWRERQKLSPSARRPEVSEDIGRQVASDRFAGAKDPADRVARYAQSAQRQGQGKLPVWYPGRSAGSVMKAAYDSLSGMLDGSSAQDRLPKLEAIERAELAKLRTLEIINRRAKDVEDAQHAMSAAMREGGQMSLVQHQALANAFDGGPTLDELTEAVIGGRFNAALVYANFASFATEFAVADRLGRLSRGEEIELHPLHCERLGRMLRDVSEKGDDADQQFRAALRVRALALELMPEAEWWKLIEASRRKGLSHRLGSRPR